MPKLIVFALIATLSFTVPGRVDAASSAMPQERCAPPVATPIHIPSLSRSGIMRFTTSISVVCPADVPFELALTSSNGCTMSTDGAEIKYALYLDAGYNQPVLNCIAGGYYAISGVGSQNFVLYGIATVPNVTILPSKLYADSITAQLRY